MTTENIPSLTLTNCFVYVDDAQAAHDFYSGVLGLTKHTDVENEGFRWLTFTTPNQPELEIVVQQIGIGGLPMTDEDVQAQRDLLAKGLLSALIFTVDDVDAVFEHVSGAGAEVLQEPTDQFYGVRDCAFRDPAGNMLRFNQPLAGQPA
ncbi:VOC family protein [Kribbia dieselivorans]|uniref:VOC family protein n=1 Tax=Kribbia dieselivorans TaxID=331526 RepID=UPI0008387F4E|nr:VOC family protein [Kribbia dieselivorans]